MREVMLNQLRPRTSILLENSINLRLMRQFLLLVVVHELLTPVRSINGVIWDKNTENFVPIVSIPTFAALNQEFLNRSRAEETHNFQERIVKLSYYEIKNIVHKKNNGTAITGVIGELWNTLADLLNFTLKPEIVEEKTIGFAVNHTFKFGLLHLAFKNKTDVIPRVEAATEKLRAVQFTQPLIKAKFQYYIRPNTKYVQNWMLNLFSKRVWFAVLTTYIFFGFCSYLTQSVNFKIRKEPILTMNDYFFYNFGVLCSQTYYPSRNNKSARMVECILGIFSLLINTAFNALVIGYMTQTFTVPPFKDLAALLDHTSYSIYTVNGSSVNLAFELSPKPIYVRAQQMKRLRRAYTVQEMYEKICTSKDLTTGVLSDDIKKASGMYICRINPVGDVIVHTYIVSGISHNFKHKRSIDIGLLRLHEYGIGSRLWNHWVESQNQEDDSNMPQAIVLEQIYLVMSIFYAGLLLSLIFFIFENVMFYCNKRRVT
ncbi:putative glutamate receptor [Nomia melanderi]|uniref:putative glutamate receptor n=1 Tax=Nomia melanderi TaxID=2448451 RepID=UPI0013047999|nr:uncharacterized protein LOC116427672 [Nomia melanderi]